MQILGIFFFLIALKTSLAEEALLQQEIALLKQEIKELKEHLGLTLPTKFQEDCPCDLSVIEENIKVNSEDIIENKIDVDLIKAEVTNVTSLTQENVDSIGDNLKKIVENSDEIVKANNLTVSIKDTLLPPVGSIIAWIHKAPEQEETAVETLPNGWQRCDGSEITVNDSPFFGFKTPDLNSGSGRFLRGGTAETILTLQDDALQEHTHDINDPGHGHEDSGHSHSYSDCGYNYILSDNADDRNVANADNCETRTSYKGYAKITNSYSNIEIATVKHARKASETRPKNMAVEYIMRIL